MLLRAFGPAGAPFPGPLDPEAAVATARRFEVSARIAARQGKERLAAELGAGAAEALADDRRKAAAVGLRLQAAARRVAAVAAAEPDPIPLVFLKFMALESTGVLAAGSREACDVDVLAPEDRAAGLWQALVAAGWRGSGLPDAEHQLPALIDPAGGVVEIHRLLPGVRPGGGARSATFPVLDALELLVPLPGTWPGRSLVPAPEVQAAHGLVHGLGQHGFWPGSYSLLRMLADLSDLDALTERAAAWVEKDVPPAEAQGIRRLCALLAAGELPPSGTDEEVLLRHMLAGRLDPDYETSLRLALFRSQPTDRSRPGQLVRIAIGAVFLSDVQIDALYGPPRTRLGYLGRRLARPFDLLGRLGRYGARWVRLKSRP